MAKRNTSRKTVSVDAHKRSKPNSASGYKTVDVKKHKRSK